MLQAQNLDSELQSVIVLLNDVQKRAMLAIAHAFSYEEPADRYRWEGDPEFLAEMEARCKYYEDGGKMVSAEEVESKTKALLEKYRNKLAINTLTNPVPSQNMMMR